MSMTARLSLIVLLINGLPAAAAVLLLEHGRCEEALGLAVLWLVTLLALLVPIARCIAYLVVGRDLQRINRMCRAMRDGESAGAFVLPLEREDEHELIRLKRHMNWMLHAAASREQRLQSRLHTVTRNKQEYQRRSTVDALTGVYNRGYFEEIFPPLLDDALRLGNSIALILIDCDGFKQVNDVHGHQKGDELLQSLGAILKNAVRESVDIPFRYGGDEFGVILSGMAEPRLQAIAETVRSQFAQSNACNTTLSMGIAFCDGSCDGIPGENEFKRLADQALYQSKRQGKNRIVLRTWTGPQSGKTPANAEPNRSVPLQAPEPVGESADESAYSPLVIRTSKSN
jgi:diguanylate cyclase (GGDEF)-like protein